ncbi:MAG: MATE family efflux transporter [Clostridia bacterium]|nr:MATE family efflux transporter [Clostridia bacterium]
MRSTAMDLTKGPVGRGLLRFAAPLLFGLILQQLYNTADAWVLGNFGSDTALAAVTSTGSLVFLIVGFFNGTAIGGGVVISKYVGMRSTENVRAAVYNNIFLALIFSAVATVLGLAFTPTILTWMNTPASVLPDSRTYLSIYFAGITGVIMYNTCMSVMRSLGDSKHPLYYLIISSLTNIALDLLFVAVFHMGTAGAAIATVIAQVMSSILCIIRMIRARDDSRLQLQYLKPNGRMIREILAQGIPTGIQNSVISIGNMVVQGNINMFDQLYEAGSGFVIAGQGAYSKVEGFVFLPVNCMSMSLPTFISQNLGAKEYNRAKRCAVFGILCGMISAEIVGILLNIFAPQVIGLFTANSVAIRYGAIHARTTTLFYFLLAFSHCAAGVLRGCGKAFIPMATMLSFWCVVRTVYVTLIVRVWSEYRAIALCYPITWTLSTIVFLAVLLKSDWIHGLEKKQTEVR